ncbi:hypothetical protein D3C72_405550 [compost metagenome]
MIVLLVLAPVLSGCATARWGETLNPEPLKIDGDELHLSGRALAGSLISRSDQRCENYLIGLVAQRNVTRGGLSLLASGLGTIGSVVAKGQAANAFAGAATFVSSSSATAETTVFSNRDLYVIYDAVKVGRRRERERLLELVASWPDPSSMTSHEVLARITPYDLDCGISYGMTQISQALNSQSQQDPTGKR